MEKPSEADGQKVLLTKSTSSFFLVRIMLNQIYISGIVWGGGEKQCTYNVQGAVHSEERLADVKHNLPTFRVKKFFFVVQRQVHTFRLFRDKDCPFQ